MGNESNGTTIQNDIEANLTGNADKKLSEIEEKFRSLSTAVNGLSEKLDKFDQIKFNSLHKELETLTDGFEKLKNSLGSNNALKGFASAAKDNAAANKIKANAYEKSVNNRKEESQTRFDRDFKILEQNNERLQIEKKNADTREFEALSRNSERQEKLELARDKNFQQQYKLLLQEEHFAKELERKIKETEEKLKIQARNSNARNTRANAAQLNAETNKRRQDYNDYFKEARLEDLSISSELKKARLDSLKNGGNLRYTNDFSGGLANWLSNANSRMMNRGGITGGLARVGTRLGGSSGWFGKLTGSVMKSGTAAGVGVNVGGLVLGGFATAIGAAVVGLQKFTEASLKAYGSMEKIAVNLEVVYGSKTQSEQIFSSIKEYATHSPFSVSKTAEFAVLLKQSGVYATEVYDTLKMIGDVSSGDEEKMKRIANNYAQIQAIGHASMLDMRQFAYAGLPIYEEVAKYLKVSQLELRSMISDGKVTSEVIENVFKNMTGEGGIFNNAVLKGSKTYASKMTNLKDKENLVLANFGEYFWNSDTASQEGSIMRSVVALYEKVLGSFEKTGQNLVINDKYSSAVQSDNRLNAMKSAYLDALKENNTEQAKLIGEAINNAKSSGLIFDESEIRAARANYFYKEFNINPNNLSSEEEIKSFVKMARAAIEEGISTDVKSYLIEGKNFFNDDPNNGAPVGTFVPFFYKYKNISDDELLRKLLDGSVSNELIFDDKQQEEVIKAIENLIPKTKTEQQFISLLKESLLDPKQIKDSLAVMQISVENFANVGIDAMKKISNSSKSILTLNSRYKEMWKQTKEGQEETRKAEIKEYEDAKSLFEKLKQYYDYDKNRLKTNLTREQIEEVYKSGFLNISEEKFNPEDFEAYNPQWKENAETILNNTKNALDLLTNLGYTKSIIDYSKLEELQKEKDSNNLDTAKLTEFLFDLKNKAKFSNDKLVKAIIEGIFQKYSAESEFAKNPFEDANGKEKEEFIPLWKRIISIVTGWSTDSIKNGKDFIKDYNSYNNKQIAAGGIQGLVNSGVSFEDILSRLAYGDDINKQNVRQIDWTKSLSKLAKSATNGGSVRENAAVLQGMSQGIASQLSIINKLKENMLTVGEDWSVITKDLKDQFDKKQGLGEKNIFDNAFGFLNEQSDKYNVNFDENGILSVYDAEGKLVDSVENLKNSETALNNDLKNFVDSIKFDSIIKPLDTVASNLNSLSAVINVSNSVLQKTNELQNQALQARARILGGTQGSLGALYRATESSSKRAARTLRFNPDDKEASAAVADEILKNPEENKDAINIIIELLMEEVERRIREFNNTKKMAGERPLTKEEQDKIRNDQRELIEAHLYDGQGYDQQRKYFGAFDTTFDKAIAAGAQYAANKPSSAPLTIDAEKIMKEYLSQLLQSVSNLNLNDYKSAKELYESTQSRFKGEEEKDEFTQERFNAIKDVVESLKTGNANYQTLQKLLESLGVSVDDLTEAAQDAADAIKDEEAADAASSLFERFSKLNPKGESNLFYRQAGNTFTQQGLLNKLGMGNLSFSRVSEQFTRQALENQDNKYVQKVTDKYFNEASKVIDNDKTLSKEEKDEKQKELKAAFAVGDYDKIKEIIPSFDKLTDEINEANLSTLVLAETFIELGKSIGNALQEAAADSITSSMSILGESAAKAESASSALAENFRKLGSELASNLGSMMVQAGLSMMISAGKDKKQLAAGLALAAAGGGLSFLGGYLGADNDSDDDSDSDYERLLRIKEDLTDLLKQAREDSIYYENQTRHGNALAVNSSLGKSTKVNDAIITPSGNVISTHPDDYLIATKTPETLTRGGGAPTINFSVVDKSTGVKVTKQSSKYNEKDNSIDFEAVIESKVTEIIAGAKGDEAFSIRAARQAGVTYVG